MANRGPRIQRVILNYHYHGSVELMKLRKQPKKKYIAQYQDDEKKTRKKCGNTKLVQ